jgi:hypothetical protein
VKINTINEKNCMECGDVWNEFWTQQEEDRFLSNARNDSLLFEP